MSFTRNNPFLYDIDPDTATENIIKGLARQGTLRRRIGADEGIDLDVPDMQGAALQQGTDAQFDVPDIRKVSPEQAADMERQAGMDEMSENLESEQPGLFDNISRGLSLLGNGVPQDIRSLQQKTQKEPIQLTRKEPEQMGMVDAAQSLESEQPGLFDNITRGLSNFLTSDKRPIEESPAVMRARELEQQRKEQGIKAKQEREGILPGQDPIEESIETKMGDDLVKGKSEPELVTDHIIEATEQQTPASVAPDMFMENPKLQKEWRQLTGLDYSEEMNQILEDYSSAATKDIEDLDEDQRHIKERIDSGNLTTADYVMLGASILLPAIIASVAKGGGLEAALAGFAGGVSGVAEGLKEADIQREKDWEKFAELAERKTALRGKMADFKDKILKAFPTKERNEILEGQYVKEFENPSDPENPIIGMKLPGVNRDELAYDIDNFGANTAKEDLKTAREQGKKALDSINMSDAINGLMEDYLDVIDQIIAKTGQSDLRTIAQSKVSTYFPEAKNWGQVQIDWNGEKQNASIALDNIVERVRDRYNKAMGYTRLTDRVEKHFDRLLGNPFGKAHEGLLPDQARVNALRFWRYLNENLVNTLSSEGFIREPLEKKYIGEMENRIRQRQEVLNRAAEKKSAKEIFTKARRQ